MKHLLRALSTLSLFTVANGQPVGRQVEVQPRGEYANIDVVKSNQAIATLAKGTPEDRAKMVEQVIGASDQFAPPVFYALSAVLLKDGRKDDALFWFYAGQLRGRFDATICADQTAAGAIGILNGQFGPAINEYAFSDTQKLRKVLKQVIEWDATTPYHYDHRWINLHGMGSFVPKDGASLSADEKSWPDVAKSNREKYWSSFRLAIGDNPEDYFADGNALGLVQAAIAGDTVGIDKFVKAGADVNISGKDGATPLWFALLAGNKTGFAHLMQLGADPTKTFAAMRSSVALSCLRRKDNVYLELMLDAKFDANTVLQETKKPIIFETIGFGQVDDSKLKLLVSHKADVNSRAPGGDTPLMYAVTLRQFDKVLYLLANGADPSIRKENGVDMASGLFKAPNLTADANRLRLEVIAKLAERGYKFDDAAIAKASQILNFDEATGKSPPKWVVGSNEPNPEWVKMNPVEAEAWYQAVKNTHAPK